MVLCNWYSDDFLMSKWAQYWTNTRYHYQYCCISSLNIKEKSSIEIWSNIGQTLVKHTDPTDLKVSLMGVAVYSNKHVWLTRLYLCTNVPGTKLSLISLDLTCYVTRTQPDMHNFEGCVGGTSVFWLVIGERKSGEKNSGEVQVDTGISPIIQLCTAEFSPQDQH